MKRILPLTVIMLALLVAISIVRSETMTLVKTLPLLALLCVTAFALSIPHSEDDDTL